MGNRKNNKRRLVSQKKRNIRKLMGKPIFFTLTKCNKKLSGSANYLNYKANMHSLIFKQSCFGNVRYQSSIITRCNFNHAKLLGVDFCNSNLKQTSFKNAYLEDVCFINCNLQKVDFMNATLKNVVFVCTNIKDTKNLKLNETCVFYNTYPKIVIDPEITNKLLDLSAIPSIYNAKIIHVNKHKLNNWTLQILEDLYGDKVYHALKAIHNKKNTEHLFTIYSYKKHIENYLKI